jgi:hypothetical protein
MSIIREGGGFDPKMAIDYGDIDFGLRVQAAGYRIVYTPFSKLNHFECSSAARIEPVHPTRPVSWSAGAIGWPAIPTTIRVCRRIGWTARLPGGDYRPVEPTYLASMLG